MEEHLTENNFKRFSKKSLFGAVIISLLYLVWTIWAIGFRADHLHLLLICILSYFLHPATRKFIIGFSVFIIYWLIYDAMKAIPNYTISEVHIKEPYAIEKLLFGIKTNLGILTPNEYFSIHSSTFWDITAGIFYLNWIPVPLMFAFYLWLVDKVIFLHFSYVFLIVNLIGFIIYYIYPAAPPWYVTLYGFTENFNIPSHEAGLARFDAIFGISLFNNIYARGSHVFAAIPSLHAAYPVIVLFYGIKKGLGWFNVILIIFMVGIWFAAVYTNHHYIIDVILGALCALIGILLFEKVILKTKMNIFFTRLSRKI